MGYLNPLLNLPAGKALLALPAEQRAASWCCLAIFELESVMDLALDTAKAIYRSAIHATASDQEGSAWWSEVAAEILAVIRASDVGAGAAVIAWWHADWSQVGDTPRAAAGRIRREARARKIC